MQIGVIIAAGGRSRRFGDRDKLAEDLGGRSVLLRTVEVFSKREEVTDIVVAGPHDDFDAFRNKFGDTLAFHGAKCVPGGKTHRWETVKAALDALADDISHVAVHDAARPAVTRQLLDRLFRAADNAPAVIPGVAINDTIKKVSENETDLAGADESDALAEAILGSAGKQSIKARAVRHTMDRADMYVVQTPQVFSRELLQRAYEQNDRSGATDDAALVERLGETVYVVQGDARNVKITTPADLELVRAILNVNPPAERPAHKRF